MHTPYPKKLNNNKKKHLPLCKVNKVKNKTCFVERETQADIFIKMIILKSASGLHALIKRLLKSQQKKKKKNIMNPC